MLFFTLDFDHLRSRTLVDFPVLETFYGFERAQDKNGDTALTFAVSKGDMATTQFFLEHGAYVDARNKWGDTPFFRARTWDLQKLLLKYGANEHAKNFANRTELLR